MKKVFIICVLLGLAFVGCTTDNFIKTGLSNGHFDGSLLEYLEHPGHSYDWDSTALMVRHAGVDIVRLFEGQDSDHKEITFFGPTNHSIRRYLLQKNLNRVTDLDPEWCRKLLLCHVVDGKIYREKVTSGTLSTGSNLVEGGVRYNTIGGTEIILYTFRGNYQGVDGLGALKLYMVSAETTRSLDIASTDIEPNNCVVHSMVYYYDWKDMHSDFK